MSRLEQEVNDWRDEAIKWNIRFRESEESHLETKELLHSTISEIKRHKQALEEILGLDIDVSIYDYAGDVIAIAAEALKGDKP